MLANSPIYEAANGTPTANFGRCAGLAVIQTEPYNAHVTLRRSTRPKWQALAFGLENSCHGNGGLD